MNAWTVSIRLSDTTSDAKRGKPLGVAGASVFSWTGTGPAPSDIADWKFETNTGKTMLEVSFPSTLMAGSKVWLTAFWFNGRKESGPACAAISVNLPGGGVSQAA